MYVYIDETGNTGNNLFDEHQPVFMASALMTRCNFDATYGNQIRFLSSRVGVSALHANSIGTKIAVVAKEILHILEKSEAQFFISQISKDYFAVAKIVDTIFDSYENISVPWHFYNWKPLRLQLVLEIAKIITQDDLKKFWASLTGPKKPDDLNEIQSVLCALLQRVGLLSSTRYKTIISQSIQWALDNPEAFNFDIKSKSIQLLQSPNVAAFMPLLQGVETQSSVWNQPVHTIVHDRQVQFKTVLTDLHKAYSNARAGKVEWPTGESLVLPVVSGSHFLISNSAESAGLQITDMVLWLFKRTQNQNKLPPECLDLMRYVEENGKDVGLSFQAALDYLYDFWSTLESKNLTDEELQKAQVYLNQAEQRRLEKIYSYAKDKNMPT